MTRSILSIGCNTYEHVAPQLLSAESDAKKVYDTLIGTNKYHYRKDASALLLSPNTPDVRRAIQSLYQSGPTDVCVYFAGHAESRDGRLYLKFKDTDDQSLPPTSITLGELLDNIVQITQVRQLNVIIDACNAGGISADLSEILEKQAGKITSNVSISILAGSGPVSAAIESRAGGKLTTALTEALAGHLVVQRWSQFLELAQISSALTRVPAVARQSPSHWSMNLRGPNAFAPNVAFDPAVAASAAPASYFQGGISLTVDQERAIGKFAQGLRTSGYIPQELIPLQSALSSLPESQQVSVYLGLSDSIEYYESDRTRDPPQRELMLIQSLVPLAVSSTVKGILSLQTQSLVSKETDRITSILTEIAQNSNYLVNRPAGFSEIYYLPIRLSLLLGWIGFLVVHGDVTNRPKLLDLVKLVVSGYAGSLVAIDDRQAPGLAQFVVGARIAGWHDELDQVLGCYFNSLLRTGGRIALSGADAKQRIRYLLQRHDPSSDLSDVTQKPTELAAAILFGGAISGMDGVWDQHLHLLDHLAINFFLATEPTRFADEKIPGGENVTLTIGSEFHTLAQLRRLLNSLPTGEKWIGVDRRALDAMSLQLPDRVNWPSILSDMQNNSIPIYRPKLRIAVEDPESGTQVDQYVDDGQP